jgi:hypothetical protein
MDGDFMTPTEMFKCSHAPTFLVSHDGIRFDIFSRSKLVEGFAALPIASFFINPFIHSFIHSARGIASVCIAVDCELWPLRKRAAKANRLLIEAFQVVDQLLAQPTALLLIMMLQVLVLTLKVACKKVKGNDSLGSGTFWLP